MTVPGQFPRRISRAASVTVAEPADVSGDPADGSPPRAAASGSWPWRRAALLLCIAAQLITIAALEGADPIPATWAALLLAIAPAPLAAVAAFAPATGSSRFRPRRLNSASALTTMAPAKRQVRRSAHPSGERGLGCLHLPAHRIATLRG